MRLQCCNTDKDIISNEYTITIKSTTYNMYYILQKSSIFMTWGASSHRIFYSPVKVGC